MAVPPLIILVFGFCDELFALLDPSNSGLNARDPLDKPPSPGEPAGATRETEKWQAVVVHLSCH